MLKFVIAWFGFIKQNAINYFEIVWTAGERPNLKLPAGLPYVEVPLYWQIIEDPNGDDNPQGTRTGLEFRQSMLEINCYYERRYGTR